MGRRGVLVVAVAVALAASTCSTGIDPGSAFPAAQESASGAPNRGEGSIGGAAELDVADTTTSSPPSTPPTDDVPNTAPITTTSSTAPPERRATLLFAGDVLPHLPLVRSARRPDGRRSPQPPDPAAIVADAERARDAGAEVVVVSVHWGVEYRADPTSEQRAVADEITRSGAVDLVVGHHAHVPQPAERVNGRWVVFGLGNLVSNQSSGCCSPAAQDGVIATAEVVVRGEPGAGEAEIERVVFTPVRVDHAGGFTVAPVAEALAGTAPRGSLGDDELRASLWRTTEVVTRTADPDLVPSAQP